MASKDKNAEVATEVVNNDALVAENAKLKEENANLTEELAKYKNAVTQLLNVEAQRHVSDIARQLGLN